jgi:hypothetical protein
MTMPMCLVVWDGRSPVLMYYLLMLLMLLVCFD